MLNRFFFVLLPVSLLLALAFGVRAEDVDGLALDTASARGKMLEKIGIRTTSCPDLLAALQAEKLHVIVADATPVTMKLLAANTATVQAFTEHGGWLMLWGLTPEGLADFNKGTRPEIIVPFAIRQAHGLRTCLLVLCLC